MQEKPLVRLTVEDFIRELSSDSPAPGGGSVAALAGALGAALVRMVTLLSKKQEIEGREALLNEAEALSERFLQAVDHDTEAFLVVSRAYKMPKETDDEKKARSKAIQEGMLGCTESPYHMMELCEEGMNLAAKLSKSFNTNAASDLAVGIRALLLGAEGAWMNVRINTPSLKNREIAESYEQKSAAIMEKIEKEAKELVGEVSGKIG